MYIALGRTKSARQKAYQEYVMQTIPEAELELITRAIQQNQVTGGDRFREQLTKKHKIRFSNRGPGRPKKGDK